MTPVVATTGDPEPDQQPHRWDDHVTFYQDVFEPLTQTFAVAAIEALSLEPESHVLDSGAGTGGAALELARRGHRVTAIDASNAMVRRAKERASSAGLRIESLTMDGQNLSFHNASFDVAFLDEELKRWSNTNAGADSAADPTFVAAKQRERRYPDRRQATGVRPRAPLDVCSTSHAVPSQVQLAPRISPERMCLLEIPWPLERLLAPASLSILLLSN